MSIFNLQQISMEGNSRMLRNVFDRFLDDLILEHAIRRFDVWNMPISIIPYEDKKQFLSYLVNLEDYQHYTSNPILERNAIEEYEPEMQWLINNRIDDLYHEIQYELSQGVE